MANNKQRQISGDALKDKGNAAYKSKNFAEALEWYGKAIEANPNDITYHNNKAAVYMEMGELDAALEVCTKVLERRYDINSANQGGAAFEKVAKVMTRIATIYTKQKKFKEAGEWYEKSLMEDNSRHTRNAMREMEAAADKHEKDALLDPKLAEEYKEKGNEFFKNQQWADAKKEYDEALRRNPKDHKLYSNRAAALTKLCAHPDAIRDLDKCLELDPTFVKGYSRKGVCYLFMKEYKRALEMYEKGLALDPNSEECKKGKEQVLQKVREANVSGAEPDEQRLQKAMADPEIQNILKDPNVNFCLQKMQEDPKEISEILMKDQAMASKIQKLIVAGVLKVGSGQGS